MPGAQKTLHHGGHRTSTSLPWSVLDDQASPQAQSVKPGNVERYRQRRPDFRVIVPFFPLDGLDSGSLLHLARHDSWCHPYGRRIRVLVGMAPLLGAMPATTHSTDWYLQCLTIPLS